MYRHFHGETQEGKPVDEWIRGYFPDFSYHGTFIDVGAYEPVNISNSFHFEMNGWNVWCIEANPELIPELKRSRAHVLNYAAYNVDGGEADFHVVTGWGGGSNKAGLSAVEIDPVMLEHYREGIQEQRTVKTKLLTLSTILEREIQCGEIDVLSIDVEGSELKVLEGLDLARYKPKVCCIENNFVEDTRVFEHLSQRGYKLDRRVSYNEFYVREQTRLQS